ncbi:MAG: protein translocase subunit SecF [Candidatus Acidiferrales bacterium]
MEFFKQVDLDWMGKTKYFVALSLSLLIIGGISWIHKGSLQYGIDFRGGTVVDVRFAGPPPLDKIRRGLAEQGLGQSEIVPIHDIGTVNSNEVEIGLNEVGEGQQALDSGKTAVLNALHATLGTSGEAGKADFNAVGTSELADYLTRKDPLNYGVTASTRYTQLAKQLTDYRDHNLGGVVSDFGRLQNAGATPAVVAALGDSYYAGNFAIIDTEIVGPKVGAELRRQAILVTLYALAGMLVYIAFRFEWVYGAAAVIAVFHDVLITLGLFSLLHFEISLTVIAALLTLVGYSMNDTIVIFDRVRENLRLMRREPFTTIVNRSINQTLSRTILTSGLTFLTVLVLFVMGGQVLRSFSFALVVGILVGTYSSFGIAAPLVVAWNHWRDQGVAVAGTAAGNKARRA